MRLRAMTGVMLLSVALMTGCSRERIDWKSAEAADTQEAYDHFLERHPDSPLATQARARLAQLAEEKDWQRASAADTADAYKQFLAQHASGKWAEEARIRIENFALDSNPSPTATLAGDSASAAAGAGTVATPGTPAEPAQPPVTTSPAPAATATHAETPAAKAHPAPLPGLPSKPAPVVQPSPAAPAAAKTPSTAKPASAPTAKATSPPAVKPTSAAGPASKPVMTASADSAGYGIQLGAFSTQASALTEWKRLQTAYDSELHGLFAHAVPVQVGSGTLFRLQSPVGEEARARGICAALTKHGQPCVVVLPEKR